MVTVTEMENRIRSNLEPISCKVTVLSEEDHKYSVVIVSNKFKDLPLIKRHRMGLSYPWMECRFCCSETKLEEVDGFKACCRCVGKIVPFCRAVVRQVVNELPGKGWDVKVIADEEEWLEALSLVVKNECGLWGEGRKAIVFAIRCKKDDITTFTLVDRLSVLAATSAAISRVLTSPKQPTRRKGP